MVLYMNMKQLGKRRNTVDQVPFTYAAAPGSLRELIAETVKLCVSRYIEAMNRGEAVLSNAQIDDMAHIGKIAFGIVYGEKAPDVGKSIETAMLGHLRAENGCVSQVSLLRMTAERRDSRCSTHIRPCRRCTLQMMATQKYFISRTRQLHFLHLHRNRRL